MDSDYGDDPNKNLKDYNISTPMHVDSYALLQKKFEDNKKSIKELEDDLRNLLSIAKESQFEYYSQIKSGLEKIKFLVEDNVECKDLLLKEYEKTKQLQQEEENLDKDIQHNKEILCKTEKGKSIIEKYQLISNISTLSEEIDKYSEINNDFINVIELGKTDHGINKLNKEIEALKNENEILKNLNNETMENKIFDKNEEQKGIFSCMNKVNDKFNISFK
jgi:hypothetical protein